LALVQIAALWLKRHDSDGDGLITLSEFDVRSNIFATQS
jgi:hypothetical protein